MQKVRIGIIGTGGFAQHHARLLSREDGVEVAGFCSRSMARAEAVAGEWPGARGYDRVETLLEDGRIDAAFICVTPDQHGETELAMIERGIPFLVEKPVGLEMDTVRQIERALAKSGLVHSVGYHFRYTEAAQRAREALSDTVPVMAAGYWTGGRPGAVWWNRMASSGGQFVEQTTHMVDMLRYVCGEAEEVHAVYAKPPGVPAPEGADVPDAGSVTVRMKNGMAATLLNTCVLPRGHRIGLDVYTPEGVFELHPDKFVVNSRAERRERLNSGNPYVGEIRAFLHAVRTGDASRILSTYADAVRTLEISLAANASAASGQPVKLGTAE